MKIGYILLAFILIIILFSMLKACEKRKFRNIDIILNNKNINIFQDKDKKLVNTGGLIKYNSIIIKDNNSLKGLTDFNIIKNYLPVEVLQTINLDNIYFKKSLKGKSYWEINYKDNNKLLFIIYI